MTNEEKCWKIIKDMKVSGPWQEHLVHTAMMTLLNSQWLDINDTKPDDGQRVMTWNTKFHEVRIQVFNEYYQCWDTEDGDDSEWELHVAPYWMYLPAKPEV